MLLLSIFTPWSIAADGPGGRVVLKNRQKIRPVAGEESPASQAAAADRWKQLKSQYQSLDEGSPSPVPRTIPSRVKPPVRPIPDHDQDEDSGDWAEETVAPPVHRVTARPSAAQADPLPISPVEDEPAWLSGELPDAGPATHEARPATASVSGLDLDEDDPDDGAQIVSQADDVEDVSPVPQRQPAENGGRALLKGSRRPRSIREISPHYDTNIDQDIRQFARLQATQYGLQFGQGVYPPRQFPGFIYQWEASNMYHYPLYFEDPALERYGHTRGCISQPVASIARFGTQLVFLPYQMTLDPVCTPMYTLGWYRPGDCAPKLHYQPPLNGTAALVEVGVVTGLFFAIP